MREDTELETENMFGFDQEERDLSHSENIS